MPTRLKQSPLILARKILTRAAYTARTGYWHTGERCCPDFPDDNFVNHFKVYRFASQFCVGRRILDVGCGTGYGAAHLAQSAENTIGIDLSRQALRYARGRYGGPRLQFVRMSAASLTFADRSFDFIISTENFEHLRDHRANLREMSRVLSDDGMLLLATPNPEMSIGSSNRYHTHEFTYEELRQIVGEFFCAYVISENTLAPRTDEGRRMAEERQKRGAYGTNLLITPNLWNEPVNVTWLSNLSSFFCFARLPRRQ